MRRGDRAEGGQGGAGTNWSEPAAPGGGGGVKVTHSLGVQGRFGGIPPGEVAPPFGGAKPTSPGAEKGEVGPD